ncbi:MAG: hypothetical protein GY859_25585 [Desulfobacterales bacterium]|nr:hypothetical protein [Desulfobacterales bacterium]
MMVALRRASRDATKGAGALFNRAASPRDATRGAGALFNRAASRAFHEIDALDPKREQRKRN